METLTDAGKGNLLYDWCNGDTILTDVRWSHNRSRDTDDLFSFLTVMLQDFTFDALGKHQLQMQGAH